MYRKNPTIARNPNAHLDEREKQAMEKQAEDEEEERRRVEKKLEEELKEQKQAWDSYDEHRNEEEEKKKLLKAKEQMMTFYDKIEEVLLNALKLAKNDEDAKTILKYWYEFFDRYGFIFIVAGTTISFLLFLQYLDDTSKFIYRNIHAIPSSVLLDFLKNETNQNQIFLDTMKDCYTSHTGKRYHRHHRHEHCSLPYPVITIPRELYDSQLSQKPTEKISQEENVENLKKIQEIIKKTQIINRGYDFDVIFNKDIGDMEQQIINKDFWKKLDGQSFLLKLYNYYFVGKIKSQLDQEGQMKFLTGKTPIGEILEGQLSIHQRLQSQIGPESYNPYSINETYLPPSLNELPTTSIRPLPVPGRGGRTTNKTRRTKEAKKARKSRKGRKLRKNKTNKN
jgi:hypothetical protein